MFEHNINPIIFSIGPLEARWYGLMYVLGFIAVYLFLKHFAKKRKFKLSENDIDLFMIILIVSMLIGARIFEVLFYNLPYYMKYPSEIIKIWHGGLSFHGGLAAMLFTGWLFCRAKKVSFLQLADIIIIPMGLALAFGRLGNFINGELYGRITSIPWCMKFKSANGCRHPSQLYEVAKNLVIFGVIFSQRNKKLPKGFLLGLFLILYSTLRFFIEFVREPEVMVGFLTMGQFLCLFMLAGGIYLVQRKRINKLFGM
jgi:phosphatidylglycerol:prolipoprotein diacylglycerol transferase